MHVLVLKGGSSYEREVSLRSGSCVENALKKLLYRVTSIDVKEDIIHKLSEVQDIDIVFLALHGKDGEDGCIQGALELLGIPYTHSHVMASAICMNKIVAKHIFTSLGIDVAYGKPLSKLEIANNHVLFNKPYILKPIDGGSSQDVLFFLDRHDITLDNYPFKSEVMLEEYVQGRELHVAVIADKAAGIVEVILPDAKKIYDYDAKYINSNTQYIVPAQIPNSVYTQALESALKVHKFLHCKGISRSDFRYDEQNNRLVMLECNTNPGLTKTSLVPKVAKECMGISFEELIETIISDALKD